MKIIDMSIVEAELVEVLTNSVKNYAKIKEAKAKNFGLTANDVVLNIRFDENSAPVGLSRACNMGAMEDAARKTIAACQAKDPDLLPGIYQYSKIGATFTVGIGVSSFCVFEIGGDYGIVTEIEVD